MAHTTPGPGREVGHNRLRRIVCGATVGHLPARPSAEHHPMPQAAAPALLALAFEARLEDRVPLEARTPPVVRCPAFGESARSEIRSMSFGKNPAK